MLSLFNLLIILAFFSYSDCKSHDDLNIVEKEVATWLSSFESQLSALLQELTKVNFNYTISMTDENSKIATKKQVEYANFTRSLWVKAKELYKIKEIKNPTILRQLFYMTNIDTDALEGDEVETFSKLVLNMSTIFSTGKVCDYFEKGRCSMSLSDLEEVLTKSRHYDQLEHVWTQWRNATGSQMTEQFEQYVKLLNKAAKLNGFENGAEMWLDGYETPGFAKKMMKLWEEIKPLYEELHAYVRHRLIEEFPNNGIRENGLIPAHVLGDMWAQSWSPLLKSTSPYKDKSSVDVTNELIEQGYSPIKMFELAEEFFESLGFDPLPESFWKKSIFVKPPDVSPKMGEAPPGEMNCHAQAWDFSTGDDFRIKMCTKVNGKDLDTIHHELGHIQYYIAYKSLINHFRGAPNDGFHEAIGNTISLSTSSTKHLKQIGLLKDFEDSKEFGINFLYAKALDKLPLFPFALTLDKWRWDVFEGKIKKDGYNCDYWKLVNELQGIKPPNVRKSTQLDAGSKYHIASNRSYLRYFIAAISELMFHKSLCIAAGEYEEGDKTKPLYKCDIYKSKKAGQKLREMMELGSSVHWSHALHLLTGFNKLSAQPLLEYFEPLYEWLKKNNEKNGVQVGWDATEGENLCQKDPRDIN